MAVTLALLAQGLHSPWTGAALLLVIAFFIQSAHSLVGGAASMDFGGKKAVATAAGLFDGAQYLAGAIVTRSLGPLLDAYKDPRCPAPSTTSGRWRRCRSPSSARILIARLWNVVPGRVPADPSAEKLLQRARMLALLHQAQRVTLGFYALVAGAASVLTLILPQQMARELMGHGMLPGAIVQAQLHAGARIGLALVALAAAFTPRPPRALVRALMVALIASLAGPIFSALTGGVTWPELAAIKMGLWLDGLVAVVLLGTSVARSTLRGAAEMNIELFHATNDEGSAEARKRVVDRGLVGRIDFATSTIPRCAPTSTRTAGRRRRRSGTARGSSKDATRCWRSSTRWNKCAETAASSARRCG